MVVPPLRERLDDLASICAAVLERLAADAGVSPPPTLDAEAMALLARYPFPGNVRELENLLHRAVALSGGDVIGRDDLGLADDAEELRSDPTPAGVTAPPQTLTDPAALPADLAAHLDQVERDILVRALERHHFNRTAAGANLGLTLRQMRYRMARLGVNVADHQGERDGP
jgi:two-component system response regulator PilR (NtrC family)